MGLNVEMPTELERDIAYVEELLELNLDEEQPGVAVSLIENTAVGIGTLEHIWTRQLPDIIHPHAFGFHRNRQNQLIPNTAGKNGMRAAHLFINEGLKRNSDYTPTVLFSANLPGGEIMQGETYANAGASYFFNKYISGTNLEGKVNLARIPIGSDARGEIRAAQELQQRMEGILGRKVKVLEIQQAAYLPKMSLYLQTNRLDRFSVVPTESILLYLEDTKTIRRWYNIYNQALLEVQGKELKMQKVLYMFAKYIDPKGLILEWATNKAGPLKEKLQGRQS